MNELLISVESCVSPLSTRGVNRGLSCMRKIKLTKGKYALVDNEDYEFLNQWKWHFAIYARRRSKNIGDEKAYTIPMHRVIIGAKHGEFVDHINRNKLDNRRQNLRICTKSQNNRNLGYKGYYWHKQTKRWSAQISIDNKRKHLGRFDKKSDARKAYLIEYNKCFQKDLSSISFASSLKSNAPKV